MPAYTLPIFAAFLASYAAAYAFGQWDEDKTRRSHRQLLRLTSLLLAAWTLIYWRLETPGTVLEPIARFVAFGMLASLLGDLSSGGLIPSPKPFITTMAAFALGHTLYLLALLFAAALNGPVYAGMAIGMVCSSLAWGFLVRNPARSLRLNLMALVYCWLLGALAGGGVHLALLGSAFAPLALGVLLFAASDLLLGRRELRGQRFFLVYDVIWLLYISGQLLIVTMPLALAWTGNI